MEFLKDENISFCSFFEVKSLEEKKENSKGSKKAVYLQSTEQNEKVMILYSKD